MIPALFPPGTDTVPICSRHTVSHRIAQAFGDRQRVLFAVDGARIDGSSQRFEFREVFFIAG